MRLIKQRAEIGASLPVIWSILADFGEVAAWAPYMKHSALIGDQKTGVGSRRELRHAWGFRLQESVTEWTDGRSFSFDVVQAPYPMKDVKESWLIEHVNGQTIVATSVEYAMRLGILGAALDAILVRHIVRREMRAGLRGLKEHAEGQVRQNILADETR